eukprot:TRINITY_DN1632_c0_g1_i1.p1 TRINITY_DN1632_c0_g1~~TRINITY_DN1632_c0_g1_i1.p1  ORF type:complete len:388 (-),score=54.53 TRINITY_DN1632_c0_g1_i1:187-1329(-)
MYDPRDFITYPGHRKEPQLRERQREERTVLRKNLMDAGRSAGYRSVSPAVPHDWEKSPPRANANEVPEIARQNGLGHHRRGRSSREKHARRREQRRLFGRAGELDRPDSDDVMLPEYLVSGSNRISYDVDLSGKRRIWCFNALASDDLPYQAAESAEELKEERNRSRQRSVPEDHKQNKKQEEWRALHLDLQRDEELHVTESPRLRRCFPKPFGRLTRFGRAKAGRVHAAPQPPKHVSPSPRKSPPCGPPHERRIHTEENKQVRQQPSTGSSSNLVNQVLSIRRGCGLRSRGVSGESGRKPSPSDEKKAADKKQGRTRRRSVDGMCIPNLGALEWDALEIIRPGPSSRPRNLLRNRNALDYPSTALARLATCNLLGCLPH